MTLDLISWIPEGFFLLSLLTLLCFGITPGATPFSERLAVPLYSLSLNAANNCLPLEELNDQYRKNSANSGPTHSANFLGIWAITWCFINFLLVFNCPFHSLIAGGVFLRDLFSIQLTSGLWLFATLVLILSLSWQKTAGIIHPEYVTLTLLAIIGQHLLICSSDLIAIYMCLELQSFAIVVLCSLNYRSTYSIEAGIKYFLLSAFSSCLLLLGIGLIYWETGTTQCHNLVEYLHTTNTNQGANITLWLGVWLVSLGLLWKLSAAPLHLWVADVYIGAWSSVTLFLSTLPKIAVLGFWLHTWHPIWYATFDSTLIFFSAISLIVGAVAPLAQTQLKRLLALSSVGHIGFMLIPLCAGSEGFAALLTYLSIYLITNLGIWGLIMWPLNRPHQKLSGPQYIWDLVGFNQTSPAAATAWAGIMLSLAGLPPVAGFLGKLGLFWWALNGQLYFLVAIGLISTLLSTIYYLRILKIAYVDTPIHWASYGQINTSNAYLIAIAWSCLAILLWHGSPFILTTHIISLTC